MADGAKGGAVRGDPWTLTVTPTLSLPASANLSGIAAYTLSVEAAPFSPPPRDPPSSPSSLSLLVPFPPFPPPPFPPARPRDRFTTPSTPSPHVPLPTRAPPATPPGVRARGGAPRRPLRRRGRTRRLRGRRRERAAPLDPYLALAVRAAGGLLLCSPFPLVGVNAPLSSPLFPCFETCGLWAAARQVSLLDSRGAVVDSVKGYAALREVGKRRGADGHLRFTLNGDTVRAAPTPPMPPTHHHHHHPQHISRVRLTMPPCCKTPTPKPSLSPNVARARSPLQIFHLGTLDQGWWPEGLLTPPSDDAQAPAGRTGERGSREGKGA